MLIRTRALLLLAVLTSLPMASPAAAQVRHSKYEDRGGFHEFLDDPLHSQGASAPGWRLLLRRHHPRVQLLRPRTQFVTEMLKSVETM